MVDLHSITIDTLIFVMLVSAFGVGVGGSNIQASLNNIFAPVVAPGVLFQQPKGCSIWDVGCNAANVALATEQVAVALEYPGIIVFTIIGRISSFVGLITSLFFGSANVAQAVPFLPFVEVAILLIVAVEVFKLARGNSGGVGGTL